MERLSVWIQFCGFIACLGCGAGDGSGGSGGRGGSAGSGGRGGSGVACEGDVCACTEAGIRAAIAEGGGPYTFDCDGPTRVVTETRVVIDNDVILDGEGNLTVDGNQDHPAFGVHEGTTAELRGFVLTQGFDDFGGGIRNEGTLTLSNSTVSGNSASDSGVSSGGGIGNSGTLTLIDSTVSSNSALGWGGGISNSGTLTLMNSTVSGNSAISFGAGGIWNAAGASLTLSNSTVSANSSTTSGVNSDGGGGIGNEGTLTLTNSTVSGNNATSGSAILSYDADSSDPASVTLSNSLIDGECDGVIASGGYNIESPGNTCGFDQTGDQASVPDPMLGPLQNNGGPTATHALEEGSPAINQIPQADCEVTSDQRGEPRPETGGTLCDVGAFELQP